MHFIKKYMCTVVFLGMLFVGVGGYICIEDYEYSDIENKILQTAPRLSVLSVKNGGFMRDVEKYLVDQFPLRVELIKLKNNFLLNIGKREFKGVYLSDGNRLLEKFILNKELFNKNLYNMNYLVESLGVESVGMFIPTSISIYKDELPSYLITDNQVEILNYVKENFSGIYYSPYNVLNENKDSDIFFRTDHHWTQLGAKLMYEDYYNTIADYPYKKISSGFYGTYYSKSLLNFGYSDDIYSYEQLGNYRMDYDGVSSDSLYDRSRLDGKNKYQYFLNGDPAISLVYGEGEGEVLIFKDSFAHNYIPFLTKTYSKIHVIDPRYCNYNIVDYISNNTKISKIYYIYSLSTLNTYDIFSKYESMVKNKK